jgi:hypothetical protein
MSQAKSTGRREALRSPDDLKTRRPIRHLWSLQGASSGLIAPIIRTDGAQ